MEYTDPEKKKELALGALKNWTNSCFQWPLNTDSWAGHPGSLVKMHCTKRGNKTYKYELFVLFYIIEHSF